MSIIKLNNVRLIYPSLFAKKCWGEGSKPKYEATFMLNKKLHKQEIEEINKKIDEALATIKLNRALLSKQNCCFTDGDLFSDDLLKNHFTIRTKNSSQQVKMFDKDGKTYIREEDDKIYSGCFVNAAISIFPYNKIGKGIAGNLHGIQFVSPGERIISTSFDISGVFTDISNQVETDELPF